MTYESKGQRTSLITLDPDLSGNYVCDGTDDYIQFQAAIDEIEDVLSKEIVVGPGAYGMGDEVLITGAGSTTAHQQIVIHGAGINRTTLNGNTGDYCFRLIDAASVIFKNMTLDGHGSGLDLVYGDGTGTGHEISLYQGGFENMRFVVDAVDTWALNMQNPMRYYLGGTIQIRCTAAATNSDDGSGNAARGTGGAIRIENESTTVTYGDSSWPAYIQIRLKANNQTGVKLVGNPTNNIALIQQEGALLMVDAKPDATNLVAFDLDYVNNVRFNAQIEFFTRAYILDDVRGARFTSPYVEVDAGGVMFDVNSSTSLTARNLFYDIKKGVMGDGGIVIDDDVSGAFLGTVYRDVFVGNTTSTVLPQNSTRFERVIIKNGAANAARYSENGGTATILNGTTSITVPHLLFAAPQNYWAIALEDPGVAGNLWVDGVDDTNIVINCENDPTANFDAMWGATVSTV